MDQATITTKAVAKKTMLILSHEEVSLLADALNLSLPVTRRGIVDELSTLPRYEIVRLVLKAAEPTLLLLQDVFKTLLSFGISVRTTGCVFTLAHPTSRNSRQELDFSPQAIGTICDWPAKLDWKERSATLSSLKTVWASFRPVWSRLIGDAEPFRRRGRLDAVRTLIEAHAVYDDDDHTDEEAYKVLNFFVSKLTTLAERLSPLSGLPVPDELEWIRGSLRQLLVEARRVLNKSAASVGYHQRNLPDEYVINRQVSKKFAHDFDRFCEDIYLLSNQVKGEHLFDMMRLDIWSSRPQLYEVWTALTLLRWLRDRGYHVELLRTNKHGSEPTFRWDLSYAKDSEPCAVVHDSPTHSSYLFYQLYRTSGDMPDLCLLDGPNSSSTPMWSIDAKHSEKRGYSVQSYRRTAERYRDSFGAPLSIIAEYFARNELGGQNPVHFSSGAVLVHDCRPGGTGLEGLFQELSLCHPELAETLVCLDYSASYRTDLAAALLRYKDEVTAHKAESKHFDGFIRFAGSAEYQTGFRAWLSGGHDLPQSSELAPGTKSAALEEAVSEVVARAWVKRVVLITDGAFDISIGTLVNQLETRFQVSVRVEA